MLPAWSNDLPGYHAVLAMHAFGLEESGRYDEAEASARAALALDPLDARAHHVMAHVFEMTDRAEAGERWLADHVEGWANDTVVATHCWWHRGLFQLALGRPERALDIYHHHVRAGRSDAVADLIDASALLWRIDLAGCDIGGRWLELADAWAPHIDDGFCSFNDLHAMLAFVGARDWRRADRLVRALRAAHSRPTRHGTTTRLLGLAACRALAAFGRGDDLLAVTLLASLPAQAHRLGGSHAQRDVLHLTMRARGRAAARGERVDASAIARRRGSRSPPEPGSCGERRRRRRPAVAARRCACRLRRLLRPKGLGDVAAATSSHAWSEEQADAEHAERNGAAAHVGRRAAAARAACRRRSARRLGRRPMRACDARRRPSRRGTGSSSIASPR